MARTTEATEAQEVYMTPESVRVATIQTAAIDSLTRTDHEPNISLKSSWPNRGFHVRSNQCR